MKKGISVEIFEQLAARFRAGSLTVSQNRLQGRIEPPGEIPSLPSFDHEEYARLSEIGWASFRRGEVGALILAGGMATRFNWEKPKGLFPIYQGKSFLQLKLEGIQRTAPGIPIHIMTSFHTDEAIRFHLEAHDYFGLDPSRIRIFTQNRFPRLKADGTPFEKEGERFAAPGHGDFVECLRAAGLLERFLQEGGRYLFFSNVDNLGATIDLAILGRHIESGRPMTVEVADKAPGDKGGAPARVDGRLQLVEGFAFPEDFDQDSIEVFNTASYVFTAEALDRDFDLPWYVVEKKVDSETVIQLEHLAGDLSVFLDAGFLRIERDRRFLPVKSLQDVPKTQGILRDLI